MQSRDGHCRPFDAQAQGTLFGNGVGLVVLKRLDEAVADGDHIYAVIKGSALNNDGAVKVSYTAPSVDGQSDVIALAQAIAGVSADSISYIEAHGTGTPLGDPIEVAALTQAFRETHRPAPVLRYWFTKKQHRASGRGGRRRRPDEDRAGAGE